MDPGDKKYSIYPVNISYDLFISNSRFPFIRANLPFTAKLISLHYAQIILFLLKNTTFQRVSSEIPVHYNIIITFREPLPWDTQPKIRGSRPPTPGIDA